MKSVLLLVLLVGLVSARYHHRFDFRQEPTTEEPSTTEEPESTTEGEEPESSTEPEGKINTIEPERENPNNLGSDQVQHKPGCTVTA